MIYLEKITIKNNTYPGSHVLRNGYSFECGSVNLFVGNQGCGKSTLLRMIQSGHSDIEIALSEHTMQHGVESFFFDSEKDNPRIKDPLLYSTPTGEDSGYGYGNALKSRFLSHGEVLSGFIIPPISSAKDCVIILDEPESALSLTNQFKMIAEIKKAVNRGCQFFIATHCYPLIQSFDVISLEHYKRMSGDDFISIIKLQ